MKVMSSPATPVVLAAPGPPRPPLVRPRTERMLGGVAHGLADHLMLPVPAVRVGLLVSCIAGGFGVVLYVWLWALVPAGPDPGGLARGGDPGASSWKAQLGAMKDWLRSLASGARPATRHTPAAPRTMTPPAAPPPHATPAGTAADGPPTMAPAVTQPPPGPPLTGPLADALADHPPAPNPGQHEGARTRRRGDVLAGALLVVAGAVLLASRQGWAARPGLVIPLLVVGAGAIIAYAQLDEVERARWAQRAGAGTRVAVLRVIGGLVLVVFGVLLVVVQEADVGQLGRTLLAALAVLAGAGLVLAPWGLRLWRDLDTERAARVRESARADIAAHLHDSVLQTLALIQRRSHDPAEVVRLARAQERDLRGWIYGAQAGDPSTLAARVTAIAAEAEEVHGAVVDVVTVGDRPVDERVRPLLAALREAVFNAARHAGAPVQVYVESGPNGIEAFVKDRGVGFDLAAVPDDRLGVRESVVGRMERHGGSARVRSSPGEGTEVRLLLPDHEEVPS